MKTFNNSQSLKQEIVDKMKAHQAADQIAQGHWWEESNNKSTGCFYGCAISDPEVEDPRITFSEIYGVDFWYTYLTDAIFGGLPEKEYLKFPVESLEILPVGVDLDKIKSPFFKLLLMDQLQFVGKGSEQEAAIKQCIELFNTPFNEIDETAARDVARDAEDAVLGARNAAWAAARDWNPRDARAVVAAAGAAWAAAGDVAWATPWDTGDAAWAAGAARAAGAAARSSGDAGSASRSTYYTKMRDMLFKVIEDEYN